MHTVFPDDPEAIENTVAIAEKCDLVIPTGEFHLPDFPVPAGVTSRPTSRRWPATG